MCSFCCSRGARIRQITVASGVVLAALLGAHRTIGALQRPNVVFILADDVGREAIGCYGGMSHATPRIDELARTGMRLRHCYSMPVCHPTRICLLTGQYPFHVGNPLWGSFPAAEEKRTLAHVMKSAGYATAIAGKWQIAMLKNDRRHPFRLGFDEFCLFGWHEGPRYHQPHIWHNGTLRDDVRDRYGPDVYCDFLVDFFERNRKRPFFAFYSMALCHDVSDDLEAPVPLGPRGRYDNFGEMVEAMDERVGRIVGALDRLGLRERTLVLFTADNGSPKRSIITAKDGKLVREKVFCKIGGIDVPGGKGELTDAGTRVPTIANWPGTIAAGVVTDTLVDFSDFLPTFAELAGAKLPAGVRIDGKSFAPQLRGKPGGREWVFSGLRDRSWVRTRRWKLYNTGQLFDLATDPHEATPVAAKGQSARAAGARTKLRRVTEKLTQKQ